MKPLVRQIMRGYVVFCAAMLLSGCQTPVGVQRTSPARAYGQIEANILSSGELSPGTQAVLRRYDSVERFADDPLAVISALHRMACEDRRRDILYALSELSYATAERQRKDSQRAVEAKGGGRDLLSPPWVPGDPSAQPCYLASAVYAYLYLFGNFQGDLPGAFDRQFRTACDLYNRGLMEALRTEKLNPKPVESVTRPLPVGSLKLRLSRGDRLVAGHMIDRLLPADDYLVRGISQRDRTAGLGAPMIALSSEAPANAALGAFLNRNARIPVTILLRVDGDVCDLSEGQLSGSIELYTPFEQRSVQIGNQTVPLEMDVTAALGYSLESSRIWKAEIRQLLSARQEFKSGLYLAGPYQPGKIPVVFVHGTASSPARWAEMFNTLYADTVVRDRYQFWYFIYNTGNPILYSAALLRDSMHDLVQAIDPQGTDAALKQMVVIGHSQGGLLARLLISSSGDRGWASVAQPPPDKIKRTDSDRALLQRCLFFEPSPYPRRVVFIATPHAGSYRVGAWIESLTRRLFTLPSELVVAGENFAKSGLDAHGALLRALRGGIPTSVANMKPESLFVKTLASAPMAPEVKLNSIIAVKGSGSYENRHDGVVAYRSAHLASAESEFVVRSPHSCQGHPLVIEEVRRILLLHAQEQ